MVCCAMFSLFRANRVGNERMALCMRIEPKRISKIKFQTSTKRRNSILLFIWAGSQRIGTNKTNERTNNTKLAVSQSECENHNYHLKRERERYIKKHVFFQFNSIRNTLDLDHYDNFNANYYHHSAHLIVCRNEPRAWW